MPGTAVAYLRVSREEENIENQRYVIERYCKEHGLDCLYFPEIGVSRTEDPFKRPVFVNMLRFMEANGIRVLIVESIDRLTAEPEHWDKLVEYFTRRGMRLVMVRDEDITQAFENVIKTIEALKGQVKSEVLKVVLDSQIDSLKRQVKLYQKIKVAVAKEYVEDVRYKTRRAMQRLREEGKLYHRPRLIHYVALYLSKKDSFRDLSAGDMKSARRFLRDWLEPFLRLGVPMYRLHKLFLERFADMYVRYPRAPRSYKAFRRLVAEVAGTAPR